MATTRKTVIGWLSLTLAIACVMQWTVPPGRAQSLSESKAAATQEDKDYRISPRDVIEIRVADAPELSRTASVNADGTFLMPYLSRLKAQGKTPEELSHEIADRLRDKYLKDPHVLVVVKQVNSRAFFIMGAVNKPGVYQIDRNLSLWELISLAGGLAYNHGPTAYIIREPKSQSAPPNSTDTDDSKRSVISVNIDDLLKGNFIHNMYLEPGDVVNIAMADAFTVAGEVMAPGSFPFNEGTTLRQAIALAQGVTFNANAKEGVIFRTDKETGRRQEIKVDINAVMHGKAPDIPIQPNDIIVVPNVRPKRLSDIFRRLDNPLPPLRPPCRGKEPCIA